MDGKTKLATTKYILGVFVMLLFIAVTVFFNRTAISRGLAALLTNQGPDETLVIVMSSTNQALCDNPYSPFQLLNSRSYSAIESNILSTLMLVKQNSPDFEAYSNAHWLYFHCDAGELVPEGLHSQEPVLERDFSLTLPPADKLTVGYTWQGEVSDHKPIGSPDYNVQLSVEEKYNVIAVASVKTPYDSFLIEKTTTETVFDTCLGAFYRPICTPTSSNFTSIIDYTVTRNVGISNITVITDPRKYSLQ